MGKKSFRQFLNEPHGGSIRTDDFFLGAADAYELYSYVWDVLSFRRGGFWRKKMPPQTHIDMAADWAETNPQFRYRSSQFFHPDIIWKLGFIVDKDGYVHLPDYIEKFPESATRKDMTTRPAAPPEPVNRETLLSAIKSGDLIFFRRFLEANPSALDAKQPPHGCTVLHDLAGLGNETLPVHAIMADELIRAGADVNCRNVLGWTPIHMIAMQGQKEACELARILIAHGADVNATANDGISDWGIFWQHGHEIYEILSAASLSRSAS
jgi:hypothetical protein